MQKKSIGQFIAALRKANGMTQKQLGERLNVSDKAVSRWERDECAPDLSLIPVIAEIFSVTSDEILRGERANPETAKTSADGGKRDKQVTRLLNDAKTKLSIRSIISAGIAMVGLLAAMICNFGFNRAYIGFIVACIFFLIAVICEAIFVKLAFSSVSTDDFESEKLSLCKKMFVKCAAITYFVAVCLFCASLPLAFIPWDTYMGVAAPEWFKYGLLCGVIFAVVYAIVMCVIRQIFIKNGKYIFSEKETQRYQQINSIVKSMPKRCLKIFLPILIVTIAGQTIFNIVVVASDTVFANGTSFNNVEDFKKYIETPAEGRYHEVDEFSVSYFDEFDHEITQEETEEAFTEFLYKSDGKTVLTEYLHRNENVVEIHVDYDDNDNILITTYTRDDLVRSSDILHLINCCFVILYIIEFVVAVVVCAFKLKKVKK